MNKILIGVCIILGIYGIGITFRYYQQQKVWTDTLKQWEEAVAEREKTNDHLQTALTRYKNFENDAKRCQILLDGCENELSYQTGLATMYSADNSAEV